MERSNSFREKPVYVVQQVRNNLIVRYNRNENFDVSRETQIEALERGRKNTYQGNITDSMRRKLAERIEVWNNAIEAWNSDTIRKNDKNYKRLVFVTLTLSASQRHTDIRIKREILKPFIRVLRDKHNLENYIWKAEKQKNGNIHFHLIVDIYINKKVLGEIWNKCQEKLGYVTRFENKYKHRNPPSTNIKVVRSQAAASAYISKYISKDETDTHIQGATAYTSKSLVNLKYFKLDECPNDQAILDEAENKDLIKVIRKDNFEIIIPINTTIKNLLSTKSIILLNDYYYSIALHLYVVPVALKAPEGCEPPKPPAQSESGPVAPRIFKPKDLQLSIF